MSNKLMLEEEVKSMTETRQKLQFTLEQLLDNKVKSEDVIDWLSNKIKSQLWYIIDLQDQLKVINNKESRDNEKRSI